MSESTYSESEIVYSINDLGVNTRDVKQAIAELARVMKDYVDNKVLYEIAAGANDPEYSGYREKKELEKAEARLTAIIKRG